MDRHLHDLLEAAVGEPPRRVSAEAIRRRVIRRRVVEFAAGAAAVAALATIIPVGISALGHAPGPSNRAAHMVTSRHYGYTESLPRGWLLITQATHRWDGTGGPGYDANVVDLFQEPGVVQVWVAAAPTKQSLPAYAATIIRAARAAHPCSPPQTNQAITIGGSPARLLGMICPARSGFLVEIAVTVRHGTGFVFTSQSQGLPVDQPADRAAFNKFLAGIRLPP